MALIAIIFFVAAIGLANEGMWLGIVVFGAVALLMICGIAIDRDEWKAHSNWRNYWKDGGPKRR